MTEISATLAPYKIFQVKGQWVVKNNAGAVKASFKDRDSAVQYLRALYTNVSGAPKKAAETKWSGKAKPPKSSKKDAAAAYDYDPKKLAAALDAMCDEVTRLLNSVPDEDLPMAVKQARDLLNGSDALTDRLLKVMGVEDPDAPPDQAHGVFLNAAEAVKHLHRHKPMHRLHVTTYIMGGAGSRASQPCEECGQEEGAACHDSSGGSGGSGGGEATATARLCCDRSFATQRGYDNHRAALHPVQTSV